MTPFWRELVASLWRLSSRAVKVCQNKQITEKKSGKRKQIKESSIQKSGDEKKCRLVTFVSSVSRRFWLVARFSYAMKENVKKIKKLSSARAQNKT